jgi:hypothetical protein
MIRLLSFVVALAGALPLAAACRSLQWVSQAEIIAASPALFSVLSVDYDGDGHADLITHEAESSSGDGRLVRRRGMGDGTFGEPVTIIEHASAETVSADVQSDGFPDLITAVAGQITVIPGNGTGFGTPQAYANDYYAGPLVAVNFDADPAVELVAVATGNDFFVVYDNSGGTFVELRRVTTGDFPVGAAAADFDGDGRTDLAIGHRIAKTVGVYFQNADGTFTALTLPAGNDPNRVATGDIDADGKIDFVLSHWQSGDVRVYRNAGARQFTQTTLVTMPAERTGLNFGGSEIALRDLNADGKLDLLTAAMSEPSLVTFIGAGDGTFLSLSRSTTPDDVIAFSIADFDGDETLDVALSFGNKLAIYASACTTYVKALPRPRLVSLGQSARIDVSVAGFGTEDPPVRGTVSIDGVTAGVDANGRATLLVPGLALGDHLLVTTFSGNSVLAAGTSASTPVTVVTETTQVTVSRSSDAPVYGTPWPALVQIRSSRGHHLDKYILEIDGVGTPHSTFNEGILQLQFEPGPHTILARYEGSNSEPRSESELIAVTALRATPSLLHTGALVLRSGTAHALQATVSGPAAAEKPTGTVQYFEGNTLLATASLVNSIAAPVLPALARGAHEVRAVYSGDSRYESSNATLTLQVLVNQPLVMEARALSTGFVHISYVLPPGTIGIDLYRRVAGTTAWQSVNNWVVSSGIDPNVLPRGVVHEYQLRTAQSNGSTPFSNIDTAMLFTDDPLATGAPIKLAHFVELQQAVNEMRGMAGQQPFVFGNGFGAASLIRASHINGLRTALQQARSTLGMASTTLPTATAGTTRIFATDVQQLRELAR